MIPPLLVPDASFKDWLYRALIFLVVSCPCALVISIPLGFFGGIGGASKQGILIKGSNYLEALASTKTVVFDKTGTLTKGNFAVTSINTLSGSEEDLLELAAKAEYFSNHPISNSIKKAYGKAISEEDIKDVNEFPGYGVMARINDQMILAGNDRLMKEHNVNYEPSKKLEPSFMLQKMVNLLEVL